MQRLAIVTVDGRNLNVPIARVALRSVGCSSEPRGVAGSRAGNSRKRVRISLTGPESRPRTPLQRAEVLDLHHALAAFAHENKAAFEIEDLDAIAATGKDTSQQVGVADKIRAGVAQFRAQGLDGRYWFHQTLI